MICYMIQETLGFGFLKHNSQNQNPTAFSLKSLANQKLIGQQTLVFSEVY